MPSPRRAPLTDEQITAVRTAYRCDRDGFMARACISTGTLHRALSGEAIYGSTRAGLLAALTTDIRRSEEHAA